MTISLATFDRMIFASKTSPYLCRPALVFDVSQYPRVIVASFVVNDIEVVIKRGGVRAAKDDSEIPWNLYRRVRFPPFFST